MSFDDMPDLGPFLRPDAKAYAEDCIRLSRAAVSQTRHALDIPYGPDFFHKLDIFLPEDTTLRGLPVLLFFHGGAWKNGFKEWLGYMAPPLLDLPAIFISANYRLAPAFKFPVPLDDCCDALAWVWRYIHKYGGDPERTFVGGHSAGGHLATLLALRGDLLASRAMPRDAIKGCFALSAAFDFRRASADAARLPLLDLLLPAGDDGSDYTPLNFVKGSHTPMHVVYGSNDFSELIVDNVRMIEQLHQDGRSFESHVLNGLSHFDTNISCADPNGIWVQSVRKWMAAVPARAKG